MPPIDWTATLVAAIAAFLLGGFWYSPLLFGKAWQQDTGISNEELNASNKGKIFGFSFILCFLGAAVFSMFLGPDPSIAFGVGAGAAAGIFWVAGSFGVNYLFELKPLRLWLINGSYHSIQFTLYGLVFGLM